MQLYTYTQPISLDLVPMTNVYNAEGAVMYKFQRDYSNKLKKLVDRLMDFRYFLSYNILDANDQLVFSCKKISRKGRVYYEARDQLQNSNYIIAYDKWKELIPDLVISNGNLQIHIQKEMEGWSRFIYDTKEIARWKAEVGEVFTIFLEIEEDSPIQNAAFFIAISQCALFIGG